MSTGDKAQSNNSVADPQAGGAPVEKLSGEPVTAPLQSAPARPASSSEAASNAQSTHLNVPTAADSSLLRIESPSNASSSDPPAPGSAAEAYLALATSEPLASDESTIASAPPAASAAPVAKKATGAQPAQAPALVPVSAPAPPAGKPPQQEVQPVQLSDKPEPSSAPGSANSSPGVTQRKLLPEQGTEAKVVDKTPAKDAEKVEQGKEAKVAEKTPAKDAEKGEQTKETKVAEKTPAKDAEKGEQTKETKVADKTPAKDAEKHKEGGGLSGLFQQTRRAFAQRGEKLAQTADASEDLANDADEFSSAATKLKEKMRAENDECIIS